MEHFNCTVENIIYYNEESIKNAVENFDNSEIIGNLEHPIENKDFIINNVTTNENGNVNVEAQVINTIDKVDVSLDSIKLETDKETVENKPIKEVNPDYYSEVNAEKNKEDELPFELTEEERQNILGVEFAGIENGKAKYVAPEVKVKRPRGRPRKIK